MGAPPIANEASQTSLYRLRSQRTTRRDRATQYPAAHTSCKMSTDSDEYGFSDPTIPQRVLIATGPVGVGLGRLKAAFPGLWLDALLHWPPDLVAAPISSDAVSMASFRIQQLQSFLAPIRQSGKPRIEPYLWPRSEVDYVRDYSSFAWYTGRERRTTSLGYQRESGRAIEEVRDMLEVARLGANARRSVAMTVDLRP